MSEQTLRNITICNSDFTQYTQSSPYLTPLQPPQTPNEILFHSTPASIHRSQSNFSFHESYMAPTITCPPNFSQILATSENTPPRISLKAAHQVLHTRAIKSEKLNTKRVHFLQAHP